MRIYGLIPAHAGKTSVTTTHGGASRAHPRSRGENDLMILSSRKNQGSSPLTRGKLDSAVTCFAVEGLIPAHAGKTCHAGGMQAARGGSSPLTRGKRAIDQG